MLPHFGSKARIWKCCPMKYSEVMMSKSKDRGLRSIMQIWKNIVVRWLDQLTLLVFEEAVEAKATQVHWINWKPSCTVHHPHSQVLSTRSTHSLLKRGHEKANRVGIVERTIICHAEQTHTSKVHRVLYVTLSNITTFLPVGNSL